MNRGPQPSPVLPPPLPLFHLPALSSLRATATDRRSYKDVQRATHGRVEGEKVMVELMGENEVFFYVSLLHPAIHHHVITVRADHRASEAYFVFLFLFLLNLPYPKSTLEIFSAFGNYSGNNHVICS